jgi:hypothetical protein
MQTTSPEHEIDDAYLIALLQKTTHKQVTQVNEWGAQQIHGGLEFGSAIYRISGTATFDEQNFPWSLILKTARSAENSSNADGVWYWKREVLAYQSGYLHNLPCQNISAPACYDVQERPDGSIWTWMEDVKDDIGSNWTIEQYAKVAYHLGQFNGAYINQYALPSDTWVTHDWLHKYVDNATRMIEFIRSAPNHPVVTGLYPGINRALILAFWDSHHRIIEILDNLPQVFCHQDAFRRNLFSHAGKTIAIDWGYSGIAPIGAELVALVFGSLGLFEIPPEQVNELDKQCFQRYIQGLREAGWNGDPKIVRTGYALTLVLRYPIGGSVGQMLPALLEKESRQLLESAFEDKTAEDIEKTDPAVISYLQQILPEALKLSGIKCLLGFAWRMAANQLQLSLAKK